MTAPQDVTPGPNPPQLDSLDADKRMVTLQIGGNDIGFTEIVENCTSPSPYGHPCQNRYVVNGRDEIAARIAATAPKVAAVLQGVRSRSPAAREKELNAMLADQAAAAGATLVDAYAAGIGHDACKLPGVRYVEPLLPVNPAAPLHPNLAGIVAVSKALVGTARR